MIQLPEWAVWFDVPVNAAGERVRHRVLVGGRGGAKSWTIALKIALLARQRRMRILCTREFQNSIRDSSKKLIEDIIEKLGFGAAGDGFFTVTEREIRGRNGSLITFMGLNGKDTAIKSLEGYDLAWVEEAASVTQASIDALIPTIRRENSEIWWSYNPRYATDPVDRLFKDRPPPGSVIVEVHWRDNPWFPEVLRRDMEYDRRRDPDRHAHVWNGTYVQRSDLQVFKNWEIAEFEMPDDARPKFGADWGYSEDPTVLVRCFIGRWSAEPGARAAIADRKGRILFVDYEAYKIGCVLDEVPSLFAGSDIRATPRWKNGFMHRGIPGATKWRITADSARSDTIELIKRHGFDIVAARKGPGSVEDGIEFLKSYDMVVHPRCEHTIDELINYRWKTDRQTGEILPELGDKHNHVIDSLRYALEGARKEGGPLSFASSGSRVFSNESLDDYLIGPRRTSGHVWGQGRHPTSELWDDVGE